MAMLSLLQAFILGITQGLTEFLPVSSSGHLVLMQTLLGIEIDQAVLQNFDVVLHAGTLIAILGYFWKTWFAMLRRPFTSLYDGESPMLPMLLVATLPLVAVGYFGADFIEHYARTPVFVGCGLLGTGIVLLLASFKASKNSVNKRVTWKNVMTMSIGQAIAILPGFSRSGWTLSFGVFSGIEPRRATEVAFLMGAPAFACALVYTFFFGNANFEGIDMMQIMLGFLTAIISSVIVMHFFLLFMKKFGVWVWSIYLCLAGTMLLGYEFRPFLEQAQQQLEQLPMSVMLIVLFVALMLEGIPVTSTFAPGTIMLIAAGAAFADRPLALALSIVIGTIGTIAGHCIGYFPALHAGKSLANSKSDSKRLKAAQNFFHEWGFWAVLVGGWYAAIRTVISVAAGLSNMPLKKYLLAITLGSVLWVSFFTLGSAYASLQL